MTDERKVLRLEELPQPEKELTAEEASRSEGGLNFAKIEFETSAMRTPTDPSPAAF